MLVGYAHSVSEELLNKVNATAEEGNVAAQRTTVSSKMRQVISNLSHLREDERKEIEPVLQKFAHVFFEDGVSEFESTT
jgi:hypothetical protein